MTTTTTTALETRTTRAPRTRKTIHTHRAAIKLVWVWIEAWPPIVATIAAAARYGPTNPSTLLVAGGAALILTRAWSTGALHKNITDTIATVVRWDWRCRNIDTWQLPHLIAVNVAHPIRLRDWPTLIRIEGRTSIPADRCELVIRPNDSQGSEQWEHRFADWAARRYGYEAAQSLPSTESLNCVSLTLTRRAIPDLVGD